MKPQRVIAEDPRAKEAFRRWDEMQTDRAPFEADWKSMSRLIRPQRYGFMTDSASELSPEKPLSSVPVVAGGNMGAGLYAGITNPASSWAGLATPDEDLNRWQPMSEWNDTITRIVMRSFGPSMSSFYRATYQLYTDMAVFGNGAAYDELELNKRWFIDVTLSIAQIVVAVDFHGRVAEAVRRFRLTPRKAVREFGADALPPKVVEMAEKGSTDRHAYVQHILPNDRFVAGGLGARGKPWLSLYACEVESSLIRVRGYDEMPIYFPRWDVDTGATYGTGPGFTALASTRVFQQMQAATIRAAQMAADPTKLAPDRNAVPITGEFRPSATVYGGTDIRGNPLVRPWNPTPNIGLTLEEKRAIVDDIKDAFYYSVTSLTGRTGLSDAENRVIEEARLRNWAPHADRIMEEYAARKVERRFRMLWRAGQIPPPPEGVPEGTPLEVRYTSAATMALRASEGAAIRQFVGDIMPLSQVDPAYMDMIDPRALTEALHEANPAVPASVLRSREEVAQLAAQRQQMQQARMAMEAAPAVGGAMRDMAQAGAAMAGQGGEG